MFSLGLAISVWNGTRMVLPPRVSSMKLSLAGALMPPAMAMTSSNRSPRAVSGTRDPLMASPPTVTLLDTFFDSVTIACGSIALPVRRSTIVFSTSGVVCPTTLTRPA